MKIGCEVGQVDVFRSSGAESLRVVLGNVSGQ